MTAKKTSKNKSSKSDKEYTFDELKALYLKKFNKEPRGNWKDKRLKEELGILKKKKPKKRKAKVPDGMPSIMGRPKSFNTVEELEEAIERYFRSCWEPVMRTVLYPNIKAQIDNGTMKREDLKSEHYYTEQAVDANDQPVFRQVEPYMITGLALELNLDRRTLINYSRDSKFFPAIKKAKTIIEDYTSRELFRSSNVTGIIFNLKNNWGWKDKKEIESKVNLRDVSNMSDEELVELAEQSDE